MAKKAVQALVSLVMGGVVFEPRTFAIRASKNAEAGLVDVTFRVPVAEAQKMVSAAKAKGAKIVRTEATDFNTTATYVVPNGESNGEPGAGFQF